jgi:hypothetical protein
MLSSVGFEPDWLFTVPVAAGVIEEAMKFSGNVSV